jgi:hypothetical protein
MHSHVGLHGSGASSGLASHVGRRFEGDTHGDPRLSRNGPGMTGLSNDHAAGAITVPAMQ